MRSLASNCKRITVIAALLSLALLLALPMPAVASDAGVFISVRVYDGIDPADGPEIVRQTAAGFLPVQRANDGFIAYYLLPAGDMLTAVSIYETAEQAAASAEAARDFVAENLAPLLPNPPRVVEGELQIGFIEALDGEGGGDVDGLHASVRVYDDFEADDLDEFVAIVEDGFLPIMRETDGFFGYYLMTDSAGAGAAISIFDTEASAQASNDEARDFVAENLLAYLPTDPLIVSGTMGIAALARLHEGANLIDDTDESAFASVRVYDGVDPAEQAEIARIVSKGFLPILREGEGFIGYYLLPAEDKLAAISMYATAELAAASTEAARDFVAESLAPLLPNAPQVFEGPIDVHYLNAMMTDVAALYGALRVFDNYDMATLNEANALIEAHLLPAQQAAGGLFSYYAMSDGVDRVAGLSVFDSEASALAAAGIAAAFIAEHQPQWQPDPPLQVTGRLAIAALADLRMGENLAGAME